MKRLVRLYTIVVVYGMMWWLGKRDTQPYALFTGSTNRRRRNSLRDSSHSDKRMELAREVIVVSIIITTICVCGLVMGWGMVHRGSSIGD